MYFKTVFVIIDILAAVTLLILIGPARRIKKSYGRWLIGAFISGIVAILANIMITVARDPLFAEISYCAYFASIDWILYCLTGFSMLYTEHISLHNKGKYFYAALTVIDTVSIFANIVFKEHFYIYEREYSDVIFYQTSFRPVYYVHLAIDYNLVLIALFFICYKIAKTYSIYRIKYIIILSVLLLVVVLNILYMTFSLVLDASVIFYAVAGILIYFGITVFVPRTLKIVSVDRAVDDMNEGLIMFDISNICIFANAFARSRFDMEPEVSDLSREPMASVIRTLSEEGRVFGSADYSRPAGDDSERDTEHYNIRYNDLTDKKGRSIGSYFLIEDTTETQYLLRQLNEARITADSANKAKSSFLASMSHEIRTPLNSVLGMNEMILRTTDDKQITEYAENILHSGETLLSLINDILDFSKIEANKMEIVEADYDPHKLLRECYTFFSQSADAKDLYISVRCDENMPSVLCGDTRHIKQILSNIISNAIKYTKEGGVTVNMDFSKRPDDRIDLILTVTDTGIGIDPSDMDRLFDEFRRVNEQKNATIQGTGLGLAITKRLVGLMNGSIKVDSRPGDGSKFTVTLPQNVSDYTPAGPFVREPVSETYEYKESFSAEDAYILAVDDVKLNLRLITALLKKTGVKIDTALGGLEAIELCRNKKYDCILLDHRMPDPDGVKTYGIISKEGLNTDTPVIMLTANALTGADREYLDMGFAGYLSKPVRGSDLEDMLGKLLPQEKVTKH